MTLSMKKTNGVWQMRGDDDVVTVGEFAELIENAVGDVHGLRVQRAAMHGVGWGDTPALDVDIERLSAERSAVLSAVGDWCVARGRDPLAPFVDEEEKQSLADAIVAARDAFRRGRGGA